MRDDDYRIYLRCDSLYTFDESSMESCLLADHLQSRGLSTAAEQQQQHQTQQPQQQQQQQQQQLHHQHKQQLHQSNELLLLGSEEVQSLEEAKRVIGALKARQRAQAHQMLAWRRTLKLQEELVVRLTREKADQLRSLSSQLLLFESRLCRKQKEIEASLAQRESIILRQQKVIKQLQSKLRIACNELLVNNNNHHGSSNSASMKQSADTASLLLLQQTMMRDSSASPPCCDAFDRLDSLGDSDSAVVLEEAFSDDLTPPRFRSNYTDVTLIRSVSDAVEPKYNLSSRRSNGLLRRPEVLETVYSVEEDADADNNSGSANNTAKSTSNNADQKHQQTAPSDEIEADEEDNVSADASTQQRRRLYQHQHHQQQVQSSSPDENKRLRDIYGSFERLDREHNHHHQHRQEYDSSGRSSCKQLLNSHNCCGQLSGNQRNSSRDDSQQAQVTYNRVMSNHRSVTKPKDVKYKRINKAKSKSLEELRGRLRNWVEKGNKIAISLDQSYA
ncbi:hypothetical protein TKK_0006377 [Trichogramma kaykai]